MTQLKEKVKVPKCECGGIRFNLGLYSTCERGCGKLGQPLSAEDNRAAMRLLEVRQLPNAIRVPCLKCDVEEGFLGRDVFTIVGCYGLYRRVARKSASRRRASIAGAVLCYEAANDRVCEVVPWKAMTADLAVYFNKELPVATDDMVPLAIQKNFIDDGEEEDEEKEETKDE